MAKKNHRMCVSCRQTAHRDTLWRVVRTFPNCNVALDEGMGRSAYVCRTEQCLKAAQKKNRLGRALRSPIPPQIYEVLEQRLANQSSLLS